MRLAFPMWRRGFAKVCGSVILEAERRGHHAVLLHKPERKSGEGVAESELAVFQAWGLNIDPDWAWRSYDAIIGDPSVGEMADLPAGPRYALDFVWELRMRRAVLGATRCWSTDYQRARFGEKVGHDGPVVGMTALDALSLVDPATVRVKYSLGDKPILLLFALKFGGVGHLWRQTVYRWWHYHHLLRAIRKYADRRGMAVVVKTREKNHDPQTIHDIADRVIYDESLWPYTSAELVKTAALVVHFQSGAVHEAAAAGVAQVSIAIPKPYLRGYPGDDLVSTTQPRNIHAWPGVVQSVGYRDAAALFDTDRVWNTTVGYERVAYNERFNGPLDGKSAARVLDVVEERAR